MDTSEIYVKMCEKAKEIQEFAPLDFGSWYAYLRPLTGLWCHPDAKEYPYGRDRDYFLAHPIRPVVNLIVKDFDGSPMHIYEEYIEHCWLPRQDQLQEILFIHKEHLFPQCVLLREFIREGELYILHFLKSMEQLWLAFVMYKKFNKIWNGEDWVKEIE